MKATHFDIATATILLMLFTAQSVSGFPKPQSSRGSPEFPGMTHSPLLMDQRCCGLLTDVIPRTMSKSKQPSSEPKKGIVHYWPTRYCTQDLVDRLRRAQEKIYEVTEAALSEYRQKTDKFLQRWDLFQEFGIYMDNNEETLQDRKSREILILLKVFKRVRTFVREGRGINALVCRNEVTRRSFWDGPDNQYFGAEELELFHLFLQLPAIRENEGIDMTKLLMAKLIHRISGNKLLYTDDHSDERWDNHDQIVMFAFDARFGFFKDMKEGNNSPYSFFYSTLFHRKELSSLEERRIKNSEYDLGIKPVVPSGWYRLYEHFIYGYPYEKRSHSSPFSFEKVDIIPHHTLFKPRRPDRDRTRPASSLTYYPSRAMPQDAGLQKQLAINDPRAKIEPLPSSLIDYAGQRKDGSVPLYHGQIFPIAKSPSKTAIPEDREEIVPLGQ